MRLPVLTFGLLLPILAPHISAQPPAAQATSYAEESFVIEHLDTSFTFAADGTGSQERTLAVRVQSEAAVRALGVISISYAGNSEQVEILYARVRRPDGTVVDSDTTGSLDMPAPVTREAPFYSDLKDKQLPIRSLRVGDTLEWKVRITRTKAEVPGQFWGQQSFTDTGAVVLSETFELRVPSGIYVNVWSPTAKPTETTEANQHIYRWTTSQLKPTAGKQAEADAEAKKKAVWTAAEELDAEEGKLPSIAWTTFKSWEDVGAWYHGLEADRVTPSPEIKAKATELIAGKSTDEEKIRALYAYVATQIRYIGIDFGIGRYQPHTAAEILTNQYGDCKDKHTLLATMLSAVGIPSDAVLIGAGVRFNSAVPSPSSFNHVITHLTVAGQPVWLDATTEIAPYRMLSAPIRDEQALIVPPTGAARLDRTPVDPPFPVSETWDSTGSLDANGISHSRLTLTFRGDDELAVRAAFRQIAPAQYDPVVQQFLHNMGYGGTTSNAEVSRPEDTAEPFKISFDYEREKAGDWPHLQTIPQLAPVALPRFDDKDPLVRSLDLGAPRVEISHAAMKLPDGWTAVLPEAVHLKSPYTTYDQTYRFEKGTVYSERRVEILKQKVPQADLKTYKKWANDADVGDDLFIQLVRHDSPATAAATTPAPDSSTTPSDASTPSTPAAKAAKLIQQAYEDIQKMDLYNAKDLLDQARKLSPDHEYFWNTSGFLHMRNGEMTDALTDYQKELTLHPADFQRMYPVIIQTQLVLSQRKEALDSLRAWCKTDPANPAPATQLLFMLIEDGDAKTAVTEGEAALTRLHANGAADDGYDEVKNDLGQAYILSGEKQKGAAMLRVLLQQSDNAGILNDVAYTLADASLELPLAESSTRAALNKLTEESSTWTLDEDPQTLQGKSHLILAAWDTLGWALFHEGKLPEAQSYLEASWRGDPGIETGKHLGDLLAARGDKSGALATYELALATQPPVNALGVRTEPTPKMREVQTLADALRRGSAKSTPADQLNQMKKLIALRTLSLGPAAGRSGQAEYRLLIKEGKLVKSEPTGDKSIAGGSEMLAKASFTGYFPADSHTSLVRLGFINCHSTVCELVLR